MTPRLSIGVTTRNRPDALARCLASLDALQPLAPEVLVFDDGSDPRATATLPVRIIRDAACPGYIVGRNRLVREAAAPFVLLLDDDTRVISAASVERALTVLERDARAGAVGFAQAEADGRPWPAAMQPAKADYACVVASFIGFAHLLRRDLFLRLGGYRESFVFYGEEKEFCLRLIDAGCHTVYLPDALVSHLPDTAGRSQSRYLRFVSRNDCLNALYNDPLPRVLWTLPARFLLYFRMRRGWGIRDPWGWLWLMREVARVAMQSSFKRTPVSRATIKAWRARRLDPPRYDLPVKA
ncbi:MAG TPA: glycosyltransferase [Vicinamibacterales bacterium]|jgi:GT2 family glycosyltransferase